MGCSCATKLWIHEDGVKNSSMNRPQLFDHWLKLKQAPSGGGGFISTSLKNAPVLASLLGSLLPSNDNEENG